MLRALTHAALLTWSLWLLACSGSMTATELADAVGASSIAEEDEILATCRVLSGQSAPATAPSDPRQRSLHAQVRTDRTQRAKALLDAVGLQGLDDGAVSQLLACSEAGSMDGCGALVAELSPKVAAADGPVLAVVGLSLQATSPADATRVGRERLLTELAALTRRFDFAHATVLGLAQVAQLVEGMVEDVADSFGYFKGFAGPLLARVSAELIAVGMDHVLTGLEKRGNVSAASVATHACQVYQRVDPASHVTTRVLRRAILRFSAASYGKTSGMVAACRALSAKKGGSVCAEILQDQLGVPPPTSGETEGEAALAAVLQPVASEASAAPSEAQQRALAVAAKGCIEDPAREGTCTIDRVARVASVLAGLESFRGESAARFASLEARIDRFHESLSLLHTKVDRLGRDVAFVERRAAAGAEALEHLQKDVRDARERVGGAEAAILSALGKQPKTQCRDHVQRVMRARNDLARELGVGAIDPCPLTGGSGAGTIRVYGTRFSGVSVRHEELCDQRFVTVNASIGFSQGAFACSASGCLEQGFREIVAAKAGKPGAGLVLVGNADTTPVVNKRRVRDAWKQVKSDPKNAALLAEIPDTTENDDELQRLLSMLRAMSVRDELAVTGPVVLEALGKASNRRGVDVRFVLPDLTLDLATHCRD